MTVRVLVTEDEEALCALLEYNLSKEGFDVTICRNGEEALESLKVEKPDLLLLDWMLPHVSGIEIVRQVRARAETRHMPIIMLTARGEQDDCIRGLNTGADDYLTKPFSMVELLARMRAVLRRSRPTLSGDVAAFGDVVLDRETRRVRRGDREVRVGPTEFRLLDCLMQRPGRVFSREQLLDLVWGRDVYVEARTVDVHVGRLRKALNRTGERDPIRTVRTAGYALDETYAEAFALNSDGGPQRTRQNLTAARRAAHVGGDGGRSLGLAAGAGFGQERPRDENNTHNIP